jgi:hypothetical protein
MAAQLREQIQQRLQLKSKETVEQHRFDGRPNDEIEKKCRGLADKHGPEIKTFL